MQFDYKEAAITWLCANQLGRINLTEETRKYLIGIQYESKKVANTMRNSQGINQYTVDIETPKYSKPGSIRHIAALCVADEYVLSHAAVQKYGAFIMYFNPPPTCGVGRDLSGWDTSSVTLQSTHPVQGGTNICFQIRGRSNYFNPPTPCRVGHQIYRDTLNDKWKVTSSAVSKDLGVVYFRDEITAEAAIKEIVEPFMAQHPEFVW